MSVPIIANHLALGFDLIVSTNSRGGGGSPRVPDGCSGSEGCGMNVVIPNPHPADDMEAERLWQAWLDARALAMESGRIEDGIAAGHAWAAFLALFARIEKPPQHGWRP